MSKSITAEVAENFLRKGMVRRALPVLFAFIQEFYSLCASAVKQPFFQKTILFFIPVMISLLNDSKGRVRI